jgi:thymidine kinase
MAELIFYNGPMGSSKTAHALMTNFQYKERDKKVWLIKPAIDTREDMVYNNGKAIKTLVRSRVGITAWADAISATDVINPPEKVDAIICDEAQFLTAKQVEELKMLADREDIQVLCYGLRTDFRSHLFEGSKRLFELASVIKDIPVICDCGNFAVINAKIVNGSITTEGEQVDIGGDEKYRAFCYACWKKYQNKGD